MKSKLPFCSAGAGVPYDLLLPLLEGSLILDYIDAACTPRATKCDWQFATAADSLFVCVEA